MKRLYPFFYQYEVQPTGNGATCSQMIGTMATVMVFAESDEVGRARAGRYIATKHYEITEIKRAMLIEPRHMASFDGVLKKLYINAEQQGISACFDSWTANGQPRTSW
jgi:hypothetical protein